MVAATVTLVRRTGRVLVDRAVLMYVTRLSLSSIRRHWHPVACDVDSRALLYDPDTPTLDLDLTVTPEHP